MGCVIPVHPCFMVRWRLRDARQDWERKGLILPSYLQDLKLWYIFFISLFLFWKDFLSVKVRSSTILCDSRNYFSCSQNWKANFLTPQNKKDKKCVRSSRFPWQPEIPAGFCGITKSAMNLAVHDVYVYFQFQNDSPAVISVTLIDNSCSDAHVCTAAIAREQTPELSGPAERWYLFSFFFF